MHWVMPWSPVALVPCFVDLPLPVCGGRLSELTIVNNVVWVADMHRRCGTLLQHLKKGVSRAGAVRWPRL